MTVIMKINEKELKKLKKNQLIELCLELNKELTSALVEIDCLLETISEHRKD